MSTCTKSLTCENTTGGILPLKRTFNTHFSTDSREKRTFMLHAVRTTSTSSKNKSKCGSTSVKTKTLDVSHCTAFGGHQLDGHTLPIPHSRSTSPDVGLISTAPTLHCLCSPSGPISTTVSAGLAAAAWSTSDWDLESAGGMATECVDSPSASRTPTDCGCSDAS